MAIKFEKPYIDETGKVYSELVRAYSDEGKPLIQIETGLEYLEAIDIYPSKYTYVEVEE